MKKLNLGCGERHAKGWINLDFNSNHPDVTAHNLLRPLPFADDSFDVVYSSHVLEHFAKNEGERLVKECFRVLKPGGILRLVVPDLEQTCREYLRVLDSVAHNPESRKQYEWIIIELLDQMVRTEGWGQMLPYWNRIVKENDLSAISYTEARTGVNVREMVRITSRPLAQKLRSLNFSKIRSRLPYLYVSLIKRLLPKYLRQSVIDNSGLGEKHKWMYDRYSLKTLCETAGFSNIVFLSATTSAIENFNDDLLDIKPDGTPHLSPSLYGEARKAAAMEQATAA
jgi:predicted SAM-dependent methyltransferase